MHGLGALRERTFSCTCCRGIRRDAEGRYCLNDCHRAAGGEKKHGPSYWAVTEQVAELCGVLAAETTGKPVVTLEGRNGGTYAVKELVYAYAMWISPSFHLQVIRAFDGLVTGQAVAAPMESFRDSLKAS